MQEPPYSHSDSAFRVVLICHVPEFHFSSDFNFNFNFNFNFILIIPVGTS